MSMQVSMERPKYPASALGGDLVGDGVCVSAAGVVEAAAGGEAEATAGRTAVARSSGAVFPLLLLLILLLLLLLLLFALIFAEVVLLLLLLFWLVLLLVVSCEEVEREGSLKGLLCRTQVTRRG